MARRNKLLKFTELLTFRNVFESFEPNSSKLIHLDQTGTEMASRWHDVFFQNKNPITLELACGRGEYTIALAQRYPDRNFIGIDIKGARIWKGANIALENDLVNVAFLRSKIEFCHLFFARNEIDEIWITFPDPFLKKSKFNRRLTSPNYLKVYSSFLKNGSSIHLKTDSEAMYLHTKEVISKSKHNLVIDSHDVYGDTPIKHPDLNISTYYEKANISNAESIKYLQFNLCTESIK